MAKRAGGPEHQGLEGADGFVCQAILEYDPTPISV